MAQPCLPQHDDDPQARLAALEDARVVWRYGDWNALRTFAERTPVRELPRLGWVIRLVPGILRVLLNDYWHYLLRSLGRLGWNQHRHTKRPTPPPVPVIEGSPRAPSSDEDRGVIDRARRRTWQWSYRALDYSLRQTLGNYGTGANPSAPTNRPSRRRSNVTVADFVNVFRALPVPPIAATWEHPAGGLSDDTFAWLRVAGPNPEVIAAVDAVPAEFPADMVVPGEGPASQAAAEGRLFVADYRVLATLESSSWYDLPRCVSPAVALFAARDGRLVPVAIQCDRGGQVFTPGDAGWELAKHVVQVADANHHELVSHLARTHLLVEIFLMATRRQLAPNHPLTRLLVPHFEGTVFINDKARGDLIAPGGAIDRIFAGTIASSQQLTADALKEVDFAAYDLPRRLDDRRTDAIALYPWRDDARRVWDALARFVGSVVALAYPSADLLAGDRELMAWSATLARPFGDGGVHGFVPPRTAEELTRILTTVIFTASAQHAAVNFTQFPLMSFAPLAAGAGWTTPFPDGQVAHTMDYLPPRQLALQQADVLYLLSSVHYTQLGRYAAGWFGDARVDARVAELQRELTAVEAAIQSDNRQRPMPYTHLLPSLIPQSINI